MIIPEISSFSSAALLLLRVIIGIIFISSGWKHLMNPAERSKSIGMSRTFTLLLGAGEVAGGIMLIAGIWIQAAALLLILVMLGAIYFKQFKWGIGFFSSKSTGWHYDLLILAGNLVIMSTGGGLYVLV
jgi:putative oxidoreductase